MSLPVDLPRVAEAFLDAGRDLTDAELRKALPWGPSRQAVIDSLAQGQWIVPAPFGQRWHLNLHHPGADALLELLEITAGIDPAPYRHHATKNPQPYDGPRPSQDVAQAWAATLAAADRAPLEAIDAPTADLLAQHVRAERRALARILELPSTLKKHYQAIWGQTGNERARDFIHRLGELKARLLSPGAGGHEDVRREGVRLAFIADHDAAEFAYYGALTSRAARLGRARARLTESLADFGQEHFLATGATSAQGVYSPAHGKETAAERQALTKAITDASPKLIQHGGTGGIQDLGHGGDHLLAQLLLNAAAELAAVVERLRRLEPLTGPLEALPVRDPDTFTHDRAPKP